MADNPLDLSGQWHGTFAYPANAGPATPFLANLTESNGHLSGSIIEPDLYGGADPAKALIAGHRAGRSVDFTKTYQGRVVGYKNPVDYVGQLSADGASVTGMWSLLELNGTFEMYRELGMEETVSAETTAKADADIEV